MIAFYFALIAVLLLKHVLTPWGAGAFALIGFIVWLATMAANAAL